MENESARGRAVGVRINRRTSLNIAIEEMNGRQRGIKSRESALYLIARNSRLVLIIRIGNEFLSK